MYSSHGDEKPEVVYDVFLSQNSRDKPAVELIAKRLQEIGLRPFLDKWYLIPGMPWIPELHKALEKSATVAFFLGETGKGLWHHEEMQQALIRAVQTRDEYRVIPVLLPGAHPESLDSFLELRTWIDFRAGFDDDDTLKRLIAGIKGEAVEPSGFELPDEPAPYRGLKRFEAEQAEFFFGRDADTRALIEKLAGTNFVAVVGASGSGKSSFVRAGLLPKLADNAIHGSSGWRTLLLLPGADPLRALANRLASEVPNSERIETVSDPGGAT
jgi:hypothetical protein